MDTASLQQVSFPQHLVIGGFRKQAIQNHLFPIFKRLKRNEDRTRPRNFWTSVHPCHLEKKVLDGYNLSHLGQVYIPTDTQGDSDDILDFGDQNFWCLSGLVVQSIKDQVVPLVLLKLVDFLVQLKTQ